MNAISDQHSIEYSFECLDLSSEGLMFAEVSGVAELAMNDPSEGDFYVKHIILNGDRYEKVGPMMVIRRRKPSHIHLHKPARDASHLSAHLFRLIEAALYEDHGAQQAWASEFEAAA